MNSAVRGARFRRAKNNLQVLRSQVAKDLLIWYRRPIVILSTLASPVAYIIVIFFVSFSIGRNPVALVVQGSGPAAAGLASTLQDSNQFIAYRMTPAQAQKALASMRVEAIVNIPASFDDDTTAGHALVSITINNVNADEADDLRRSLPASLVSIL